MVRPRLVPRLLLAFRPLPRSLLLVRPLPQLRLLQPLSSLPHNPTAARL
jgi:hypothetical protein